MSYIVVINPTILSTTGTGMPFDGVLTATVCVAFLGTLLMGLFAKLPYAVAPGMGLNAFFTYNLVLGAGVPWPVALGLVAWSGVLFLILSLTPLRHRIATAVPEPLRAAAGVGIGLFLSFLGLKNMGLIAPHPVTFVTFGKIGIESLLALGGLVWSTWLLRKNHPLALLSGIALVTLAALALGKIHLPPKLLSAPDFTSTFFQADFLGALQWTLVAPMISILFTDLFDSLSTFLGVAKAANLVDKNGEPLRLRQALAVDAFATFASGLFGTSPGTAYIESAAGIRAGGRTGLTSVITALCFVPCLFIAPVVAMVPAFATGPVLVLVGALMFASVRELPWGRLEALVPCFLTVALIPLTFSITQGLLWGFTSWVVLHVMAGRRREIQPTLYALAAISVGLIVLESRSH